MAVKPHPNASIIHSRKALQLSSLARSSRPCSLTSAYALEASSRRLCSLCGSDFPSGYAQRLAGHRARRPQLGQGNISAQAALGFSAPLPALDIVMAAALLIAALKRLLDTPARTYTADEPNVGQAYDDWTREGLVEYYWGDHIHLGFYTEAERAAGYKRKDFKQAKRDFVEEMLRFSQASRPHTILDVGCGIGGTSRLLASKFPDARITGITLSPEQASRAALLAQKQGLSNVTFKVMDALAMELDDNSFDLVWACESGEHMPDKQKYVEEMMRVLAPGGHLAIATWCQRDLAPGQSFTQKEKGQLQFLYDEWAHPFFISKEEYACMLQAGGMAESVQAEDWTAQTLPSWRHSNWVGVWDPWIVVLKGPVIWYKVIREIIMIERMHRAFSQGLMEYGMIRAIKPHRQQQPQQQQQVSSRDAVLAELNQSLAAAQ